MRLTNAVVPFDGDPIEIFDVAEVSSVSVDHYLANGDCTLVMLANGNGFRVKESVDEVTEMIRVELDSKKEQK